MEAMEYVLLIGSAVSVAIAFMIDKINFKLKDKDHKIAH